MVGEPAIPRLTGIQLHPIKSLDAVSVAESRVGLAGGLELDRVWTLHPAEGQLPASLATVKASDTSAYIRVLNGKHTAAVNRIRAAFSPSLDAVTLSAPADHRKLPQRQFAFPRDTQGAAEWFSIYFELPVAVVYTREGFPDDTIANGPTVISTATLQRICEWFPPMTLREARRRFRTTLELDGVPAFWEDHLFGEKERIFDGSAIPATVVRFRIGAVDFQGSNPCSRCPVPARDTYTGEAIAEFQKRFNDLRRAQLPAWSATSRFDHFYRLATNTFVSSTESGKLLQVGDPLVWR